MAPTTWGVPNSPRYFARMFDELIAVLTQRAQEAPVEQVAVYPVVRDSGVDLPRVDSGHPLPLTSLLVGFFLLRERRAEELIRSDGFRASACPVDHHGLGKAPLPGNGQRRIAFPVGERKEAVLEVDCAGLIFDSEVPLAPSRRMRFGVSHAAFSPTGKRREERLHAGIGGMGMQVRSFVVGEQAHQMLGTQPDARVANGTPEKDECAAIELPTGMSERIKLVCLDQMHAPYKIHRAILLSLLFFPASWNPVTRRQGLKPLKPRLTARPQGTAACGGFLCHLSGVSVRPLVLCILIGIRGFLMTLAGIALGKMLRTRLSTFKEWTEFLSAFLLIGLGIWLLVA